MSIDAPQGNAIRTDPDLPPVAVQEPPGTSLRAKIVIGIIALLAAIGWVMIAVVRGEQVNGLWFVFAAVGSYIIGFRFYSKLIDRKIVQPDDTRATPAEILNNGKDFLPTDRRVLFGHHFAAISGAGPLVGPVLAAQMGYLPGTIWIIVGVIFAGAVQDFLVLHLSLRRRGRSLGQMARDELGPIGGWAAMIGVLTIMIILIAVLAVVVIGALAESPWGVFSVSMTIPIAILMGIYLRFIRPGRVSETSAIGVVLLLFAIIAGGWVANSSWAEFFTLEPATLALWLAAYGFLASVLPVWLLLAPRDYLSTFMKVGTIILLALAIVIAQPVIQMPAVTSFAFTGTGPAFAGALFPFLFITIACGALSGFHALISSGTTPKLIEKEKQARLIGYGGMLTESFVAIMALVAAVAIDQHLYFVMNAPKGVTGGEPGTAAAWVNSLGLLSPGGQPLPPYPAEQIAAAAQSVGEESIVSRTGGAPTLAFGMSHILAQIPFLPAAQAFWYHFAIMFEALFILTTIDAGTRVARFMLTDTLGNFPGMSRFKDPSWRVGAWLCSAIVVAAWGAILLMGVTDPLGGINMLFPLFGIANQLLAAIALAVVFTVVVKRGLYKWAWIPGLPLAWDLAVTLTASYQKVFSANPKIGYWALNAAAREARASGADSFQTATTPAQIDAVIRNTTVQGTLSVIYALLVIIVVIAALWACAKAVRGSSGPPTEDAVVPTRIFAPAGFIPTATERAVLAEWQQAGLDPSPDRPRPVTAPADGERR
ncbi:carbon starvation CstA family protein [Naumannella huperziae]